MPSLYTHCCVGRAISSACSYPFSPAFEVGCQGGDFGFFLLNDPFQKNIGKLLHRVDPYSFFQDMALCCKKDKKLLPYSLGYLTHYATDVCFHPYVYRTMEKGSSHATIERAIDAHFLMRDKRTYYRLPISLLNDGERENIAKMFSRLTGRRITKKGFTASLKRLDFSTRKLIPFVSKKMKMGESECERLVWDALFLRAKEYGIRLFYTFCASVYSEKTLKREDFSRAFSGKIFSKKLVISE